MDRNLKNTWILKNKSWEWTSPKDRSNFVNQNIPVDSDSIYFIIFISIFVDTPKFKRKSNSRVKEKKKNVDDLLP